MTKNKEVHIFDDVFRTMEELTPEFIIPLINEVFGTDYPFDAHITRLGDKHHLLKKLLETDSCMSIGEKAYHFEVESNPVSGIIAVRMFQYDVSVALGTRKKENPLAYVELHKLMVRVLDYILEKQMEIRKGVEQVMGGKVLESFYEEVLRKGHAEGHAEATRENYQKLVEKVKVKRQQGKSPEQIADELMEALSVIAEIYKEIEDDIPPVQK